MLTCIEKILRGTFYLGKGLRHFISKESRKKSKAVPITNHIEEVTWEKDKNRSGPKKQCH